MTTTTTTTKVRINFLPYIFNTTSPASHLVTPKPTHQKLVFKHGAMFTKAASTQKQAQSHHVIDIAFEEQKTWLSIHA